MASFFISGPETWPNRMKSPAFWLATGFGTGLLRHGPGTWGSLLALGIGWCILTLEIERGTLLILGMSFVAFAVGILVSDHWERKTQEKDSSAIVIDEISAMWLALYPLAANWKFLNNHALWLISTFLLFRFFDIAKPFPVSWAEKRLPGALGVMVDDTIAAIITAIIILAMMIIYYS